MKVMRSMPTRVFGGRSGRRIVGVGWWVDIAPVLCGLEGFGLGIARKSEELEEDENLEVRALG